MSKPHRPRRALLRTTLVGAAALLPLAVIAQIGDDVLMPSTVGTFYADTGWNGTHGNPHNDDYTNIDFPRAFRHAWNAKPFNAWEQAVAIGGDRASFIGASGQGPGESNLTAWDLEGNELWASEPWTDPSGFDSCAAVSTTIIDPEGDLYISDCNQLWAFHPDGDVKWVIDLPSAPEGMPFQDTTAGNVNGFVVAFFTVEGAVGGVTLYGDFVIVDREDGSPAYEPFNLGVQVGGTTIPTPASAYVGTFDPELREWYWNWVFATDMVVSADTPAIATSTGRLFLSAKGTGGGNSMYGIDLVPGENGELGSVSVAWESPLDQTGGSSPGLSPDETYVAAGTGEGNIRAFDTETGEILWNVFNPQAAAGSVSVGPDGSVYAVPTGGIAINPDGSVRWQTSDGQLDFLLDDFPCAAPPLGCPVVGASSIIQLVGDRVIQAVNVLYPLNALGFATGAPVANFIVQRDQVTGELIEGSIPYRGHTSLENILTMHQSGRLAISYGALLASAIQQAAPFVNPLLPPGISIMPNDPDLEVVEGIDEATFGGLLDGVISDGDFGVDLDASRLETAVSGEARIGDAEVALHIRRIGGRFKGWITVHDAASGSFALLFVNEKSLDTGLGPHAAGGEASGILVEGGQVQGVSLEWLVKDWS